MSLFLDTEVHCPGCSEPLDVQPVISVNAGRKPEQRAAVLDGTFQTQTCTACGLSSRLQPDLTYLDVQRGQWLSARPTSALADWRSAENTARRLFATSFGVMATGPAQQIGASLRPRLVFGWQALREKLVADALDIDDTTLELVKLAMVRATPGAPLATHVLRLAEDQDDALIFAWLERETDTLAEAVRLPRALVAEVEAEPGWEPLRNRLCEGPFRDVQRLFLE